MAAKCNWRKKGNGTWWAAGPRDRICDLSKLTGITTVEPHVYERRPYLLHCVQWDRKEKRPVFYNAHGAGPKMKKKACEWLHR